MLFEPSSKTRAKKTATCLRPGLLPTLKIGVSPTRNHCFHKCPQTLKSTEIDPTSVPFGAYFATKSDKSALQEGLRKTAIFLLPTFSQICSKMTSKTKNLGSTFWYIFGPRSTSRRIPLQVLRGTDFLRFSIVRLLYFRH